MDHIKELSSDDAATWALTQYTPDRVSTVLTSMEYNPHHNLQESLFGFDTPGQVGECSRVVSVSTKELFINVQESLRGFVALYKAGYHTKNDPLRAKLTGLPTVVSVLTKNRNIRRGEGQVLHVLEKAVDDPDEANLGALVDWLEGVSGDKNQSNALFRVTVSSKEQVWSVLRPLGQRWQEISNEQEGVFNAKTTGLLVITILQSNSGGHAIRGHSHKKPSCRRLGIIVLDRNAKFAPSRKSLPTLPPTLLATLSLREFSW